MNALPKLAASRIDLDERVATLTLDRDEVRNELTGTGLYRDVVSTVEWINGCEEVSVLVLTGAGQAFSAGGNVKHMRERTGSFSGDVYEVQNSYRRGIQQVALAMNRLEVPSIAAVNGAAIGAGFDLAVMCDLRLAADTAVFGSTFVNLGIVPGDGGAWFLQRIVGPQRAAELMFTGRVFSAPEAVDFGLVLETAAPDRLMGRARELAASIATKPPQALRMAKRLLNAAPRSTLTDFLDLCAMFQGICHNTQDHLEAVDAFLTKRVPVYRGL